MKRVEAKGTVISKTSASDFFSTVLTGEVFFNFDEVFGHRCILMVGKRIDKYCNSAYTEFQYDEVY